MKKPETAISGFEFGGLIAQLERASPSQGFRSGFESQSGHKILHSMSKDNKVSVNATLKSPTGSDQLLVHFLEALKLAKANMDEITPIYQEVCANYEFVLGTIKHLNPNFDPLDFFGKSSKTPLQDRIMTLLAKNEMTPREVCGELQIKHENYRSYFSDLFQKPELALGRRSRPTGTTQTFAYATIKWYEENQITDFDTATSKLKAK